MTLHIAGGVRVQLLREGSRGTLVLVPGLEGDPDELAGVVAAYTGPESIRCVVPPQREADGRPVDTVERMAAAMIDLVDEAVGGEPYHLGGYSFGGLLVWEMARQLLAAGRAPGRVFLVEAVYDERFWDRELWSAAIRRRAAAQLVRIVRLPPRRATAEFLLRARRLVGRFTRRGAGGAAPAVSSGDTAAGRRAYQAIAQYRPGYYDGAVTVLAATDVRHFGCDTARLWRGLARELTVRRVAGDHLTIVGDPDAAAVVAEDLRRGVGDGGLRPEPGRERVLIVTTMRWFSAARLADAMVESGFAVSVCRPVGHPLDVVDGLTADHPLRRWAPLRSIERAIRADRPDLVVCDDERSLELLRRLHDRVEGRDQRLAEVLTRSLGRVEHWPAMASRAGVAQAAHAAGLAVPKTSAVADLAALESWAGTHRFPVVVKTDGSSGGRGVAAASDPVALRRVWRDLAGPPRPHVALKRALVDRELRSMAATVLRRRPAVNVQQFRAGRDAIATVACRDGEVTALLCLEVLLASEVRGPSSVVRVVDHPGMASAAQALVRHFGLSGFCGLDFVLADDGVAWLIELNARITPTCHLLLDVAPPVGQVITLFPLDRQDDPEMAAYADRVDLPVRAPLLVRRGQKLTAAQRHPVWRRVRRLTSRPRSPLSVD